MVVHSCNPQSQNKRGRKKWEYKVIFSSIGKGKGLWADFHFLSSPEVLLYLHITVLFVHGQLNFKRHILGMQEYIQLELPLLTANVQLEQKPKDVFVIAQLSLVQTCQCLQEDNQETQPTD